MKVVITRGLLTASVTAVVLGIAAPTLAEPGASTTPRRVAAPKKDAERGDRLEYSVQPRTAQVLAEAREHLQADRHAKAEAALVKLQKTKLNPYETAQVHRLLGYVAYGREQYAAAVEHMKKSIVGDALPPEDRADVLFQIAQIQGMEKRWKDVVTTLDAWFRTVEKPNSVGYYLLALAHYQLSDLDSALEPARQAVDIAKTPQQAWLQLLLAIHLNKKDYHAATPVLTKLLAEHPNLGKGYWLQLSALHGASGDNAKALAVMELAYRKGILTDESDLTRLVQLNLLQGIPHRAAQVLEKEMAAGRIQESVESLEMLSGSWILAREIAKAKAPLARAAERAPKGDLYVRLAQIHMMQEEWAEASIALRSGLAKGGLADASNAELLLGISYFNENQLSEARNWFARAQKSGATRQQAQTWLEHIDRTLETKRSQVRVPS